ncbi:galactose oxidase-like domain-containing protein [Streptomyces hydrogenans]|uniref:galactose oxidase early set domain-containing protein n=1 Tax=Streptomyces hydrogenans TaxID=1873719 RepID=UPI00345D4AFD
MGKRLGEVEAEREELVVAERMLHRLAEQDPAEAEAAAVAPVKVQVAGRAVLLIPHRGDAPDESALPDDHRKILAVVRTADGPVQVRAVGEELGLEMGWLRGARAGRGAYDFRQEKPSWTRCGGSEAVPRNYHSVANLLPDGRVFSGGGGLCGDCATNHADRSVFTPPCLLNADSSSRPRPAVTGGVPPRAAAGTALTVTTGGPVASFVLMWAAAATHSTDNDQRRVPLTSAPAGTGAYPVSLSADKGVVLPGTYMLFALDAQGVPSTARFITVTDPAAG